MKSNLKRLMVGAAALALTLLACQRSAHGYQGSWREEARGLSFGTAGWAIRSVEQTSNREQTIDAT